MSVERVGVSHHGGTKRGRAVLLATLFAIAFAVTAWLQRPLVPWPEEYGLAAKMRWLDEHADECDAIFVGSSRVFRAFDPELFDAELAARGIAMRSFNLGVGGVKPFEMDHLLHALAERRPKRLKWILYEGGELDPRFELLDDVESTRTVSWHTPRELGVVLASIACAEAQPKDLRTSEGELTIAGRAFATVGLQATYETLASALWKLQLARRHAQITLWNVTALGQGRAILGDLLGEDLVGNRRPMEEAEVTARRGFVAFEDNANANDEVRHRLLVENPDVFAQRVAEVRAGNDELPRVATLNPDAVRGQETLARSMGAKLVHVVLPDRVPRPDRRALQRAGAIDLLLDFNRPEEHPELFTVDSRYDAGHLSRLGAAAFTRALAERFTELVKRGG